MRELFSVFGLRSRVRNKDPLFWVIFCHFRLVRDFDTSGYTISARWTSIIYFIWFLSQRVGVISVKFTISQCTSVVFISCKVVTFSKITYRDVISETRDFTKEIKMRRGNLRGSSRINHVFTSNSEVVRRESLTISFIYI